MEEATRFASHRRQKFARTATFGRRAKREPVGLSGVSSPLLEAEQVLSKVDRDRVSGRD
jgi:hypothetical protein